MPTQWRSESWKTRNLAAGRQFVRGPITTWRMTNFIRFSLPLVLLPALILAAEPKAARSIHWGYDSPAVAAFAIDMTIDESVPGSYFMAAGWNTGYFGLQELDRGRKVVLFSVWDPTKGDDPNRVKDEDRVECLYQAPEVRIKRFGGEGTGGQCMADFDWKLGERVQFLVLGRPDGEKTAYSGFIRRTGDVEWKQLVTFRVRTGGKELGGLYSFVEDFRRNGKSATEVRRARYANGWVQAKGEWRPIEKARFTASNAETEAKETIDAGVVEGQLFLATGGATKQVLKLNSKVDFPAPAADTKPALPDVKVAQP